MAASAREHTVDDIVEKISAAILEHRLAPGTKLGEDRLASIFNASRAKIRAVLARLSPEQLVEPLPQRGRLAALPPTHPAQAGAESPPSLQPRA